ncbi:hypothetical protein ITP53_53815 [Nonomuraea sp. K274]|uniref:Uncharacterized protein n=1 Tax=Nonomuraea cypriaca TaxID=1187855 RepID=A0A931AQ51_9ACTN|nr:hypothetical protein [Nonomuraea cypriaca]MBF8194395.1 hypothetical protein [Nonomuraea cypriaca]
MTDQYGTSLETMLRDIERRLQKLETAVRTKPALNLPDIPVLDVPGVAPTYPGSFSSPATVSGTVEPVHYNALRADIVAQLHGPLREVIQSGRGSGLWRS